MLVVRSPMRISFAGGGTDLPAYYERYGGMVVSTTISRCMYVIVTLNGQESVEITSSDYRAFFSYRPGEEVSWDGDLALPKAMMRQFGIDHGVDIFIASETPPGTGLGSSSSVGVGLAKAMSTLSGLSLSRGDLAEIACHVELKKLGAPIGKQDQYAAAFGGFNCIRFEREGVTVEPLRLRPDVRTHLQQNLMLFFTGTSRNSSTILAEQTRSSAEDDSATVTCLHALKAAAAETRECLESGDLHRLAQILHETWQLKKRLARGISNRRIDECYDLALGAGALGGKILGAGGGGFLMMYCEPDRQPKVREVMEAQGLKQMGLHFDETGATVLVNSLPRSWRLGNPDLAFLKEEHVYTVA